MTQSEVKEPNLRNWQRRNFWISFLFSLGSLAAYFLSATICNISESDNIGVLIIPPMLFMVHMPLASMLLGIAETTWFMSQSPNTKKLFLRNLIDTQPLIMRLLFIFPVAILILTIVFWDIELLVFPYWWLPYCF